MTISRQYDPETGLPILPDGYFWRVKNNGFTGSPYIHLMKDVNLFFFKWPVSIRDSYIPNGFSQHKMVREANTIMDWFEGVGVYGSGDYLRKP